MGLQRKHIEDLETQVRKGRVTEAREQLQGFEVSAIPRPLLSDLARLSWRCGMSDWGIRTLRPFIRDTADATDAETLEYGVCLLRSGAFKEAMELFSSVSSKENPRTFLYRGFAWMSRWEYERALPFLRAYLKTLKPRSYDAVVARVNIAACLVFERDFVQGEYLLSQLLHDNAVRGNRLLLGNSLQLSASLFVQKHDFARALALIQTAGKYLEGANALERLLLEKWKHLGELLHAKKVSKKNKGALNLVRAEASELGHWETVRDCDYYEALTAGDTETLRRIYYGTPFEAFRNRLLKDWSGKLDTESEYLWSDGGKASKKLDWLVSESRLRSSKLLQKTLRELSRDFYRPSYPTELYAQLFPGEYFNPISSPHRVHEAVRRLRSELENAKLPLEISFVAGGYRLVLGKGLAVRVPAPQNDPVFETPGVVQLRGKFSEIAFHATQVSEELNLPKRSAQRLLGEWVEQKILQVSGKGKATRYRFV